MWVIRLWYAGVSASSHIDELIRAVVSIGGMNRWVLRWGSERCPLFHDCSPLTQIKEIEWSSKVMELVERSDFGM